MKTFDYHHLFTPLETFSTVFTPVRAQQIIKQSTNQRNEDRQNNSTSINLCTPTLVPYSCHQRANAQPRTTSIRVAMPKDENSGKITEITQNIH